ncbi:MAG TPA: hypothetical protein GXX17_01635 [Clostridiales bacterium]|nr:hypothetical protein [Clostridiales bacterium]
MNVVSIISLLSLVPYLIVALAAYKNAEGYERFRRSFSAAVLGGIGLLFFIIIDSGAALLEANNLSHYAEQLRKLCAFILLLIPVNIVIIAINYLLKKPKPALFFIISAGVSIIGLVGICLYSFFAQSVISEEFYTILPFAIIIFPLILSFSSGGLLKYNSKFSKVVHWTVQGLVLASIIWFIISAAAENWDFFLSIGLVGILTRYAFVILAALLIPGIPFVFLTLEDRRLK